MNNIRIPVDLTNNSENVIRIKLDQEFDNLDILSLKLTNSEAYRRMCSDFGVIVGRITINNGFGVENAKVTVFVPIDADDLNREDIKQIYPYKEATDTDEKGVRYNLLPRVRNNNPSHRAVGTFPDMTDFSQYPAYVEVFEKYYKYTTVTNMSGDYMIFGVPTGSQTVIMDFDLFDTKSLELTANDLVEQTTVIKSIQSLENQFVTEEVIDPNKVPGFIYYGNNNYQVAPKLDISAMPNIFNGIKYINVAPFWGDNEQCDIGITRCDFKIDYNYQPTAVFFGYLDSVSHGYSINKDYRYTKIGDSDEHPEIRAVDAQGRFSGDLVPYQQPVVVVYKKASDGKSRERVGVYKCSDGTGIFKIALPMYEDYYTTNEFGDLIPTKDKNIGIATKGYYTFEFYETDERWSGRRYPQGGYNNAYLPGFRAPTSLFGDTTLGGWEDIKTSLFQYDIMNRKRRYYTIKSTYNKHKKTDVRDITGNEICWFPQTNVNKVNSSIYWNFPIDYRDVGNIENVSVIGSILMPRLYFETNYKLSRFSDTGSDYFGPFNLLNIIEISRDRTYYQDIKLSEKILGIGVSDTGKNYGDVYDSLFSAQDFVLTNDKGVKINTFGENNTWDFGDNSETKISLSSFALDLSKKKGSTANSYGVQMPYTQAIDPQYTYGAFINSTINQDGTVDFIDVSIYDLTDDIDSLIDNKVYSSFMKGEESEFNTAIGSATHYKANMFKNNFYYFGADDSRNALKDIENYFFYR